MLKRFFATALTGLFLAGSAVAQTANAQVADPSFDAWVRSQKGPITKEQYMQEAGRRWDAMDTDKRGLTPNQINQMYAAQPTPNMVKKGNNMTNPTGTETKGQNSGGK